MGGMESGQGIDLHEHEGAVPSLPQIEATRIPAAEASPGKEGHVACLL